MLQRVTLPGVELPRLYIAQNKQDVEVALANGIPFIKWNRKPEMLIKLLLRPILEEKFPGIIWDKVLGPKRQIESKVIIPEPINPNSDYERFDLTKEQTSEPLSDIDFAPGVYLDGKAVDDVAYIPSEYCSPDAETQAGSFNTISISDYCCDLSASVNIEVLQNLKLLPSFIGDIVDCIKKNNQAVLWSEGYNKKLRQAVGNFNRGRECRNLIILDVSVSIPRGIAATMIQLIDTLRYQVNADLLITGGDTGFYRHGEDIPDPDTLYSMYGGCNETVRFLEVMKDNVVGKEWGHVIAFGDYNAPNLKRSNFSWAGTKVHEAHHYHTQLLQTVGYANWVNMIDGKPDKQNFDSSWCKVIRKY